MPIKHQSLARISCSSRTLIISCLFVSLIVTPVWAKGLMEMSLEELISLQVTSAAKAPTSLLKTPAAIYVITQEDIRRSGANSIPELLKMVPGMNVAQLDSNRWAISARGFSGQFANKLLVMIDGRSVYTPFFSGVLWDVQDLVLAEIDRIEVIRGPGASLWGANAVNGIINIITRSAEETSGAQVTAWVGTEERGGLSLMQSSEIASNSYLRLTAKGFVRDDSQLNGVDADDDMTMGRVGFRWDYVGNTWIGKTTGGFYQGENGANYDLISHAGDYHHPVNADTDMFGGHLLTQWSRQLNVKSSLSFQFYFDDSHREEVPYDEDLQVLDGEFQYNYEFRPGHKLTWGGNLRTYFDDLTAHTHILIDPASEQYNLYSVFIQDDYPLLKNLTLTLGSKFEHNDFTGWEVQPNGRLLWEISETISLWGAVSCAVRTPSRYESTGQIVVALYPPGHELNPYPIPAIYNFRGSDNFKSEDLTAYEFGLRSLLDENLSVDFSIFYNDYNNLRTGNDPESTLIVDADGAYVELVGTANNDLEGETYGFEAAVEWQVTDDWKWLGSYSYMEMDFDFAGQLEAFLNSFYARHQGSLQSRLNLSDNIETDLWLTYTDEIAIQNQPEIWDLSVRLGWQPTPQWQLELVGQNLLHDHKKQLTSEVITVVSSEIERGLFFRVNYKF